MAGAISRKRMIERFAGKYHVNLRFCVTGGKSEENTGGNGTGSGNKTADGRRDGKTGKPAGEVNVGSSSWTRTSDIRINSPPFYRLNYGGTSSTRGAW